MKAFLYHIAYSPETLDSIEDGYFLLDNVANERPDWFEYWPIRQFFQQSDTLDESAYYGFFSPRFRDKTRLSYSDVMAFIESGDDNTDVFVFSPQPDIGAFFKNVFEGSDTTDPGAMATCQQFFDRIGFAVDLQTLVMDSRSVVFSNYLAAKPCFWRAWLEITEKLFAIAEQQNGEDELTQQLLHKTTYPGAVERKVFVVEGIASLLLSQNIWKTQACNPFAMSWSNQLGQFKEQAIISDALKIAMNQQGYPEYAAVYNQIRQQVFQKIPNKNPQGSQMKQTPSHDLFNDSILAMLPPNLDKVVEVGCMRGTLAKEYMKTSPGCKWIGIDIDDDNVTVAQQVCYQALCADIEKMTDAELDALFPADVWVFGDVLEHLRDPWLLVRKLRSRMTQGNALIACIPNAQHWSFQARLNIGEFRYEDSGLFDRTHLRFFTRKTILEMFESNGFKVESAVSRIFNFPGGDKYMPHIRAMAIASGHDPELAEKDAMAFQYAVRAVAV